MCRFINGPKILSGFGTVNQYTYMKVLLEVFPDGQIEHNSDITGKSFQDNNLYTIKIPVRETFTEFYKQDLKEKKV